MGANVVAGMTFLVAASPHLVGPASMIAEALHESKDRGAVARRRPFGRRAERGTKAMAAMPATEVGASA